MLNNYDSMFVQTLIIRYGTSGSFQHHKTIGEKLRVCNEFYFYPCIPTLDVSADCLRSSEAALPHY